MDTSKLKNIIIIVLLLLDICLLALIAADRYETAAVQREAMENVEQILKASGIDVGDKVKFSASIPDAVSLSRDFEAELKMVEEIIGKSEVLDQGGNIYSYHGTSGQARFHGTGEFEILLDSGNTEAGHSRIQTAKKVLSKMGLDPASDAVETEDENGTVTVALKCTWQGNAIFNSDVDFIFAEDNLMLISGRRPFDSIAAKSETETLGMATVLMCFLDSTKSTGHICSEIRSAQPGYMMSVSVSGDSDLVPVWKIETDTGDYFINGLTGKSETIF